MPVFRLEYADGKGIYNGSLGFIVNRQAIEKVETSEYIHPSPENNPGLSAWWEGPGKRWTKKKSDWQHKPDGRRAYSCGFASEAQMLDWFPPVGFLMMIDELSKDNREGLSRTLHVAVYEVPGNKVRKGKFQVMFRKDDATLVEKRELSQYSG